MAELLSVQVHVPVSSKGDDSTRFPEAKRGDGATKRSTSPNAFTGLKKVENKSMNQRRFCHLSDRKPVTIEFSDLTYSVPEGRKRGNCFDMSGKK